MKAGTAVATVLAAVLATACRPSPKTEEEPEPVALASPPLGEGFTEDFEAATLDKQVWRATSGGYAIENGALRAKNARNRPLWLKRRLVCDVRIDFTAWSDSPDGDIKVEVMGDGASYDPDQGSYESTGYIFIFGGWNNTVSTIVKRDEHRARLVVDERTRVEPGRKYRWSIRFAGSRIEWWIDDSLFLSVDDPQPLCGPGHDHFGINNWAVPVHIDDLSIAPLDPQL
ncbi:MAG: hypothetical protein HY907_18320 [Deltaproteobacteria bacterium]|nr:hypothetical protein [Deltaproteobacteria bacterium]